MVVDVKAQLKFGSPSFATFGDEEWEKAHFLYSKSEMSMWVLARLEWRLLYAARTPALVYIKLRNIIATWRRWMTRSRQTEIWEPGKWNSVGLRCKIGKKPQFERLESNHCTTRCNIVTWMNRWYDNALADGNASGKGMLSRAVGASRQPSFHRHFLAESYFAPTSRLEKMKGPK